MITERVASVGTTIVIERRDDNGAQLPSEIQGPWGSAARYILAAPNEFQAPNSSVAPRANIKLEQAIEYQI